MPDITLRDLRVNESDLAAKFFHSRRRTHHVFYRNRELLLWQYFDNPYAKLFSQGLTFKAAFDGKAMVGVFGYIPFIFNRYGTRQYGCHLSAWWVQPEYRRGPIAIKLLHELQFRMPFDACIAGINTDVAEKLYERLSWVVLRNIPRLILPVDQVGFVRLLEAAGNGARVQIHSCPSSKHVSVTPGVGVQVSELASFNRLQELDWDQFYWKQFAPSHMGPARETAYLVWRYQEIPTFKYRALIASSGGAMRGLLVFRVEQIKEREEKVIRLVDLVAEHAAAVPLLRALTDEARKQHAVMIDFFYTHSMYEAAQMACGFMDACHPGGERYWFPFLFQPLDYARNRLNCSWWIRDMDLRSAAARNDFSITKGDYEFDRPN